MKHFALIDSRRLGGDMVARQRDIEDTANWKASCRMFRLIFLNLSKFHKGYVVSISSPSIAKKCRVYFITHRNLDCHIYPTPM
jgi:hypothetical protein